MKITILSDLHGEIPPDLDPGDLLIVAGDLTACDKEHQYFEVFDWIDRQPFKKKILVAGNHDTLMEKEKYQGPFHGEFVYLNDSGCEFSGLKIWGTPRSLWFAGINSHCQAFTGFESDLKEAFDKIPDDIDILISHGPARGILDKCRAGSVGSYALLSALERIKPKLLVTGHIHGEGQKYVMYKNGPDDTICINGSYMDEGYDPVNKAMQCLFQGSSFTPCSIRSISVL